MLQHLSWQHWQHAYRKNVFCSIHTSSIVEPRKKNCSIYLGSIVEGQHMYRQEEDNLTPGQMEKKIGTHSDHTIKGQLRLQQCRVPHCRSCAYTKSGISPRVLMNGGI